MFEFKYKLEKVGGSYAEASDNLFYTSSSKEVISFDMVSRERVWALNDLKPLRLLQQDDVLFISSSNNSIYQIDKDGNILKIYDIQWSFTNIYQNHILIKERVDEINSYWFFDINKGKKDLKLNGTVGKFRAFLSNTLTCSKYLDDETLLNYDMRSGNLKWQKDISELGRYVYLSEGEKPGKVLKILGVWENEVFVVLTNNTLISLDIHTGELKEKWRDLPSGFTWISDKRKQIANWLPFPTNAELVAKENKIINLYKSCYWEIDLKDRHISLFDCYDEFASLELSASGSSQIELIDDIIYFTSKNNKIGAFDRIDKKIFWHHSFEFDRGHFLTSPKPIVSGNYLFVKDNRFNLYVFKKTDHHEKK